MKKGLELLGGLELLINKKEKVLLKLNLVREASPERAVTTHPAVAAAWPGFFRKKDIRMCLPEIPAASVLR